MLICLFICTQVIYISAEVYNGPIFDQSDQTFQQIWHSYAFNTGTGNREELQFSKLGLDKNFASANGEFMWKSLQVQEEIVIVGLGADFLLITTYNKENDSFTYKEDLQSSAVDFTMFQKWDAKLQQIKSYMIVAVNTNKDNYVLKWYQIENKELKFLWDWPFHRVVTHIDVIKINHESKLLVVSHKNITPKNPTADIYSFNIANYLDIWLFEKVILDDIPSSVSVFDNHDYTFLSISFPSLEMIHIFKYSRSLCLESSEQKHFMSHQKIHSFGLKSSVAFRVSFRWYLAVASNASSIYHISEELLFQPINNLNLGSFSSWLALPVDTYREDTILLADSNEDISIIAWKGNENPEVVGSLTKQGCENDTDCTEKMSTVSLKGSTAFGFNGHQNIIISTGNGTPLLFKLLVRLKPMSDTVMLRLNEILKTKNNLENSYKDQSEKVNQLLEVSKNQRVTTTTKIMFPDYKSSDQSSESLIKNWTEISSTVNELKEEVGFLSAAVEKFKTEFKLNLSLGEGQNSSALLPGNVTDGITFYGRVLINELNLSVINGYRADELLKDSLRKNGVSKIGGKKTLKKAVVENILFEKIGEILACDVIFADDFLEENKNVINGDIVWEGKLSVLNDVALSPEGEHSSSGKFDRKPHKHVYDTLDLEELEVDKETYIQETINGQPFILPPHNGHLNIQYLDIVNQARIEILNVERNLNISVINGKNFSRLMEEMVFKTRAEGTLIKIEGVFSVGDVETENLNDIDLAYDSGTTVKNEKLSAKDSVMDRLTRNAENLKRTIHVFQNLEIVGGLFTERINNLTWDFMNDTLKKNEGELLLNGVKTFVKPLRAKETNLSGTLNGRFVENVLTNSSDQTIRFAQVFNAVDFKNLTLDGLWDGVCVECLNRTAVRMSSNGSYSSNLTFENECTFNTLTILGFVNDIKLRNPHNWISDDKIRLSSIKSSKMVLHGSLITNNKINNMNLTNFDMLRVSLKQPETVDRDISHNNLTVIETLDIFSVNDNDIGSVIDSAGDIQLIEDFLSGEIPRVKKLLVKGNVSTSRGINGFNVSKVLEKGIRITKPITIKGDIVFENVIHFNDINITNVLNGLSLKKLEKDIVFQQSHIFLSGEKNFSTIKVTKDFKARSLNGHLMQDIVALKADMNMKGPVEIRGNVIVRGNVTTYGGINDVPVPDLLKTFSTRYNSYMFSGDLNLNSEAVTIDSLNVYGNIQNISLEDTIEDAVKLGESFNITGKKSFKGEVKLKKNAVVEGLINGVNFSHFAMDVVLVNEPTKIEGKLAIGEVALKTLETKDYFNSTLINNIDTTEWFEDSIPLDSYQIVNEKKTFEEAHALDDITVDFINGHLPSATIPLKGKQLIPVLGLFPRIHSKSDLAVSGLVNEKNLIEEFEDTVLLTGSQTIKGRTTFEKDFVVNGRLILDTILGKPVNRLVTLDGEQNIKTPLEFKGLVSAQKGVQQLKFINNVSLHDWSQKSVSLDKEQVLSGLWTVKGTVKTKNIEGVGLMEAVNLQNISQDVRKGRVMALELKNETEVEYNRHCDRIKELTKEFAGFPYLFDQFEVADEIETLSVIDSVITFKIKNVDHLIVTFANECLSSLFNWDKVSSRFVYSKKINIGPVNKWAVVYRNGTTYLMTSYLKNTISCEKDLLQGNVWIFEGDSDKYVHLVTTKAFIDIGQENSTSEKFFTLDEKGNLHQWTFDDTGNVTSTVLLNVGQGNYRFVDFRVTGGLAITNGREIKQIKDKVVQSNLLFSNAHIVALPLNGRTLTALVAKDKIVIYENFLEEKIFSVIHTYRAGSVLWFNYGPEKEAFLIFASHHKLIEVYEYKSVAGLLKKQSIQMSSTKLQSLALPSKGKYQLSKFLVVIQKKRIIFLEADMMGDFFQGNDSLC